MKDEDRFALGALSAKARLMVGRHAAPEAKGPAQVPGKPTMPISPGGAIEAGRLFHRCELACHPGDQMGHSHRRLLNIVTCILILASTAAAQRTPQPAAPLLDHLELRQGWEIQSSCSVPEKGDAISTVQYRPQNWIPTTVPSTPVAAQLANKMIPDPYVGTNMRSIPGGDYAIGKNFSNLPMPENSPYRCSWWYRTEFRLPTSFRGRRTALHLDGINYRANVWLNSKQIANSNDIAGMWRIFELDITSALAQGVNTLAVEVFAPTEYDLAITWVDWNPAPPDKDMGLWRSVYLTATGPVTVRHPAVISKIDPSLASAQLTVTAEVRNLTDQPIAGDLRAVSDSFRVLQLVELGPNETKTVTFAPDKFRELNVQHPRLWWPARMGTPALQRLTLTFTIHGTVSDRNVSQFGIREVTSELQDGYRLFRINGKPILIRGGGWSPDMLLRENHERLEEQFRYVRDMGLNTIRLEGKLETDDFFDLADRYGILIMAGWCCCDQWEKWNQWTPENYVVATASLADQIRRLRQHPSVFVWLNGSDNPPPPDVEQRYIDVLNQYAWPNPFISSATEKQTTVTGTTGVKMTGPYDYVPPSYWLLDDRRGGAYGFNTETSPGPAIPPAACIRKFIPDDHLWPIDDVWRYHAGGGQFKDVMLFNTALDKRYGESNSLEQYTMKSQAAAYEGERAMFEAYARNKYRSTGVIQWMLNNAWPSLIWHLYDYFLTPAGGYFGTKKACEPLHVQYSYDDGTVVVVSDQQQAMNNLKVTAQVYDLEMNQKFARTETVNVPADAVVRTFGVPDLDDLTTTYFLRLQLHDSAGKLVSSNFYWLSTKPDVLDFDRGTWYYTPQSQFADFTDLNKLPQVSLRVTSQLERREGEGTMRVSIQNPSKSLAFMLHLRLTRGAKDDDVRPILWEDNFFPLLPGEQRTISASFHLRDLEGAEPLVQVSGWNVAPVAAKAAAARR